MRSTSIGADCTVARVPVDHVKLPVRDLRASRDFYSVALAAFGYKLVYEGSESLGFGVGDGGDDDEPLALQLSENVGAGSHVALTATSPKQVDEFHAAALKAGGRDNGAPGERPYGSYYYAAFVIDPDGHNVEAVYHGPEARR
jgi:predicted lactoylglutathione lyase